MTRLVMLAGLSCAIACAQQRLDIKDFGARCNGGDDTAAVQKALNKLRDGGTLLVSCQAGIGSKGILLEGRSRVTIEGVNGGGFVALAKTPQGVIGFNSVMFLIRACDSCTVENLVIDANNVGVVGLGFDRCLATSVLKNTVTNAGPPPANAAILGTANQHNRYVGNTIIHTNGTGPGGDGTRGIWLGNASEQTCEWYPYVADNTIRDTAHTGLVLHAVAAVATGNLIEGMGDGAGIKTIPAPDKPGVTRIEHNTIRNGRANNQGIQLQDAYSDNLIIRDNVLSGLADSGIYGNGGNVQVIGNNFRDDKTAGITILDGRDWLIEGNTFSHDPSCPFVPGAGVRLTSLKAAIQNIRIVSNTIGDNLHGGVQIYDNGGTVNGVSIERNALTNGKSYGVLIEEHRPQAINGVEVESNCFAGNQRASLKDTRADSRALVRAAASDSCAPADKEGRLGTGAPRRRIPDPSEPRP